MRKYLLAIGFLTFAVSAGAAGQDGTIYRWVDEDGVVHLEHSVPPQYTEIDKDILTDDGVKVGAIRGRKSAEELEAERRAREMQLQKEAVQELRASLGIPVVSIVQLGDLVETLEESNEYATFLEPVLTYRRKYGVVA